jgi:hypothetical protein
MVTINVSTSFVKAQAGFAGIQKQLRYATALAMTRTAQDVQAGLRDEMKKVFDRPTPFTLNSLYLKRATVNDLTARVWLKDDFGTRAHYLMPQIEGGDRPQKRFEQLLRQRGMLGTDERAVPGSGAKLDAYGNVSRGQLIQLLSQLQTFNLAGSDANATNSKRSKAKRAQVTYFYARRGESSQGKGSWKGGNKVQRLPTGIWARYQTGEFKGYTQPVLLFVKGAKYRARFKFNEVGLKIAESRFLINFHAEYAKALATAR